MKKTNNEKHYPEKCEMCDQSLLLHEIDLAEQIGWLSCQKYLQGNDEHTSYYKPITKEEFWSAILSRIPQP